MKSNLDPGASPSPERAEPLANKSDSEWAIIGWLVWIASVDYPVTGLVFFALAPQARGIDK